MTRLDHEREFWNDAAERPELTVCHLPEPFDYQLVTNTHARRVIDIVEWLPPGAQVFDLGCGPGRLANRVALCCPNVWVHGFDVSERMIDLARVERERAGLRSESVTYSLCHGRSIPGAARFAAGWSVLLFQHLPPDGVAGYLHDVAAHLAPGARFLFQFVAGDGGEQGPFSFSYTPTTVGTWCEGAGLSIELVTPDEYEPAWQWWTVTR